MWRDLTFAHQLPFAVVVLAACAPMGRNGLHRLVIPVGHDEIFMDEAPSRCVPPIALVEHRDCSTTRFWRPKLSPHGSSSLLRCVEAALLRNWS